MNPTATLSAPVLPSSSVVPATDLWLEVLRRLAVKLPRAQFITWFKNTAVLGNEEGNLVVGLPLPTYLTWHMEQYRTMTLEEAQQVDPGIRQIVYTVDIGLKDNPERTVDLLEHFPEAKRRKLPGRQEVMLAEGIISKVLSTKY